MGLLALLEVAEVILSDSNYHFISGYKVYLVPVLPSLFAIMCWAPAFIREISC
jgi:hypothetical protein